MKASKKNGRVVSLVAGLFFSMISAVQAQVAAPKLIVGIVVDQMRYDFLYRYYSKYGNGGFKRLMSQGFNNKSANYTYIPTYTGPGHACIFTGSIPAIDGIIGNEWYDRASGRNVYCVEDSSVQTVGSRTAAGHMSPKNLLVSTLGDELRLSSNFHSRVIGISQKDRASILPAGHSANAAYWFDSESGNWITSTHYMTDLPDWVKRFNNRRLADHYLEKNWETLRPLTDYTESTADDMPYESPLPGEDKPVFPHKLPNIKGKGDEIIRSTPFGNSLTKDFAMETLKNERLGQRGYTDMLTISFSSTDYIGHAFGPNSIEIEDCYLRLDKDLAELLAYLDRYLGKDNVLLFLTADHGVAAIPAFNIEHKIPAGVLSSKRMEKAISETAKKFSKESLVAKIINDQIYLNESAFNEKKVDRGLFADSLRKSLAVIDGVYTLIDLRNMAAAALPADLLYFYKNGYHPGRSGDFQVVLKPNWFFGKSEKGTTHGTGYNYDAHVPLLWYGWKIGKGESNRAVQMVDIVPTLASMLHIIAPNGSVGKPIDLPLRQTNSK